MSTTPNLIIAGAMRCGTTSAYHHFAGHPDIFMSPVKEPSFLGYIDTPPAYASPGDAVFFDQVVTEWAAYRDLFSGGASKPIRGEASAMYLYLDTAAKNIARYCPDAHVVLLLRDPVARAYSSYQYLVSLGWETAGSFEQALRAEDSRVRRNWAPMWHYTRAGLYAGQVERLLQYVPRERLTIYLTEQYEQCGPSIFDPLLSRLGLAPLPQQHAFIPQNSSRTTNHAVLEYILRPTPTKHRLKRALPPTAQRYVDAAQTRALAWRQDRLLAHPDIVPSTRERLIAYFRDDVRQLAELTGLDLSAWETFKLNHARCLR